MTKIKIAGLKNIIFIATLNLTISLSVFSQSAVSIKNKTEKFHLSGVILEQESNAPISYVSIGIFDKPIGCISDTIGNYDLIIGNENLTDTLQISLVGYITKKIAINGLIQSKDKNISLTKNITILKEVVVKSKKSIPETFGRQSSRNLIQVSVHNKKFNETISPEIGMKIKIKKNGGVLRDFNWYMSGNTFKNIKFRVNIYSLKKDLPDALLCHEQILTTVENFKTGWNKINLEPFNITINGDFVITLQWIESEIEKKENPMAMIPATISLSRNCYARLASQDKWKKLAINLSYYVTLLH